MCVTQTAKKIGLNIPMTLIVTLNIAHNYAGNVVQLP